MFGSLSIPIIPRLPQPAGQQPRTRLPALEGQVTAHKFVPGELRQADATRPEPTRVMPAAPRSTGLDGGGGGPTPAYDGAATRRLVAASLLLSDSAAERHGVYAARRVPNSPRFC